MTNVTKSRALVLDGSLGYCIVAIVEMHDGAFTLVSEEQNHTEPLLRRINSVLPGVTERALLTEIIVGSGPGSYSGTRVAASAAVGIAAALGLTLRESPSDRALWRATTRPLSIALGTRESLEISESGSVVVAREAASPLLSQEESREVVALALAREAGSAVTHVTLRYPSPPRGSEVQ